MSWKHDDQYAIHWIKGLFHMHLNGAKFSIPSSEIVETKAIGLGTIPLIMSAYNLLWNIIAMLDSGMGVDVLTWDPLPRRRQSSILVSPLPSIPDPRLYFRFSGPTTRWDWVGLCTCY